jgi:hypothetical protein
MTRINEKEEKLMVEIRKDPEALRRLKEKCQWESMGTYAVLREFGDPRKWRR